MSKVAVKKGLLVTLVGTTFAVIWIALPYHPAYQEWRCKDSSLEKLQSLQTQMPENPALYYYLGLRLQEAHRGEEAITALERSVSLNLDNSRTRNALAEAEMALGHSRKAYQAVKQFYDTHPENPEAFLMLGRFYLTTRTFAPAAALLKDATRKFPENAECWALLSIAQQRISDVLEAEKSAAAAVRLRPKESKYWFLQAQILKQANKSEARASYETALQLAPTDAGIQADFADYLARAAQYPAAEELARKVLYRHPDDLRASGALGLALASHNDPAASPLLLKGLQNNPQDILILRTLHLCMVREGKKEDAVRWLKQATLVQAALQEESDLTTKLERYPEDIDTLRRLAAMMGRNGDYFRCLQYQARALRQILDAPAPLLAAALDLEAGGYPQIARRLAQQAQQNSKTPQERSIAAKYLRHLLEN